MNHEHKIIALAVDLERVLIDSDIDHADALSALKIAKLLFQNHMNNETAASVLKTFGVA